jgi:hypothetical protein
VSGASGVGGPIRSGFLGEDLPTMCATLGEASVKPGGNPNTVVRRLLSGSELGPSGISSSLRLPKALVVGLL